MWQVAQAMQPPHAPSISETPASRRISIKDQPSSAVMDLVVPSLRIKVIAVICVLLSGFILSNAGTAFPMRSGMYQFRLVW